MNNIYEYCYTNKEINNAMQTLRGGSQYNNSQGYTMK